jgi:hypothetical protein
MELGELRAVACKRCPTVVNTRAPNFKHCAKCAESLTRERARKQAANRKAARHAAAK